MQVELIKKESCRQGHLYLMPLKSTFAFKTYLREYLSHSMQPYLAQVQPVGHIEQELSKISK